MVLAPGSLVNRASRPPLCRGRVFRRRAWGIPIEISPARLQDLDAARAAYLSAASIGGMLNAMDVFTEKVLGHDAAIDRSDSSVSLEEIYELAGLGDIEKSEPSSQ